MHHLDRLLVRLFHFLQGRLLLLFVLAELQHGLGCELVDISLRNPSLRQLSEEELVGINEAVVEKRRTYITQ